MTPVIQIYKSMVRLEKPDYTTEARQLLDYWDDSIVSKAGFLADQTLYLPVGTEQVSDLKLLYCHTDRIKNKVHSVYTYDICEGRQ